MDSFLKINNRLVSYSDVGSGEVVVFLHGWMDSKESYEPVISILSQKYRCISIDLPGFGKSDAIEDIKIKKVSSIIHKFIKRLKLKKFSLVGHSLGGAVSIVYANRHQSRISKLILMSPFIRFTQFPKIVYFLVKYMAPYLFNKKIISPLYKIIRFIQKTTIDKKVDVAYVKHLQKEKVKTRAITALKYAYQFNDLDLYSLLRKIRKDILLVYGTKDSFLSLKPLEPIFGILNNIHLVIYEDVRHYILSYNTENLAQKIDLFLSEVRVK